MDFFLRKPYIFMSWKYGLCLLAGMVNSVDSPGNQLISVAGRSVLPTN